MPATPPPDGSYDLTSLRAAAVRRLLRLRAADRLAHHDVRTVAAGFDVHWRTVRRWMDNADAHNGTYTPQSRRHFTLTPAMHEALARWNGNAAATYRELVAHGIFGSPPRVSPATFYRAVDRELTPGQRAALKGGEVARRRHDVHALRPHGNRNDVWEAGHVEASTFVNVDGRRRKPWITWFIDHTTAVICGLAITPHQPSQDAILAAARDAILCTDHHRPFGGIPRKIRTDRGRDFLGKCVDEAFQKFGAELIVLPPYSPHLKGTVEAINRAAKHMLFKGLPGYAHTPRSHRDRRGQPLWTLDELLDYETFVTVVLDWVDWWNNDHTIARLHRRTPAQAWNADLTPIDTLDPDDLHTYTLTDGGPPRKITSKGVRWKSAYYVGEWMHGHSSAGEMVRLRHEPHHYHRVELYDADTLTYRGPAFRSDEMSPRQARALHNAPPSRSRPLRRQSPPRPQERHTPLRRHQRRRRARAPQPAHRQSGSRPATRAADPGRSPAGRGPARPPQPAPARSTRWTKPLSAPKPQDTP